MGMKLPSASTTKDGIITNSAQTLSGGKTIIANVNATQLTLSTGTADSTNKNSALKMPHYLNAEEDFMTYGADSTAADNILYLGGAFSNLNAATQIRFYTAANNSTLVGTEAGRIASTAAWTFGTSNSNITHTIHGNMSSVNTAAGGQSRTLTVGSSNSSGANNGTIIINNGGTGSARLQFNYEGAASRAAIHVDSSSQDLEFECGGADIMIVGSNSSVRINRASITDGSTCDLTMQHAGSTKAQLGLYKHAGITTATAFLGLIEEDAAFNYLWVSNAGDLRISQTVNHIGTASGTVVGTQTSDSRLKENVVASPYGLSEVLALTPKKFNFIASPDKNEVGFLAQDVESIVPEAVYETNDTRDGVENVKAMQYHSLIPVLVKAIQELEARVAALEV